MFPLAMAVHKTPFLILILYRNYVFGGAWRWVFRLKKGDVSYV